MGIAHDRLFRDLFKECFQEFLELLVPGALQPGEPKSITFVDPVTSRPPLGRREADLVAEVSFPDNRDATYHIHVEIQAQTEPDFGRRMFHYFSRLYEECESPIYPIAVFAYDVVDRNELSVHEMMLADLKVLRFEFAAIHLRRLDWQKYLDRPNAAAAALIAKMGYRGGERPRVKAECRRMLAQLTLTSKQRAVIGAFIDTYLALDEREKIEYNRIVEGFSVAEKEINWALWTDAGKEGLKRGRREGRREGRLAGQRELLVRQVERRFGKVSEGDRASLSNLPSEALEQLGLAIIEVQSYSEWQQRLTAALEQ